MNKSVSSVALRVAQIIVDFSEGEIREAVSLLRAHGHGSELLAYLASDFSANVVHKTRRVGTKKSRASSVKPINNITSRAVLRLKEADPEKFQVLSEFDSLIRNGQVLATHESMRRFGERLSKNFEPGKSRKETIGALMAIVADLPVVEIEKLIEYAVSLGVSGETEGYQRLARFLIDGGRRAKLL
ncbi:hypothetical protein [Luteimonas huabeiensis]|uniref:hypothetical protein n=1 Tax=Luteimonas huabeiensis TaxID=1244513 RepID=UPI00126966B1|nr:hypothetical protein [Luteimonas huabeiensis]